MESELSVSQPAASVGNPSAPAAQVRCADCRAMFDAADACYADDGDLLCRMCNAVRAHKVSTAIATEADPTTARNLYGAAAASAFLGVGTCLMAAVGKIFFILCPIAIFFGAATLYYLFTRPEARKNVGNGAVFVVMGSVSGILFGLLGIGIALLLMVAAGM